MQLAALRLLTALWRIDPKYARGGRPTARKPRSCMSPQPSLAWRAGRVMVLTPTPLPRSLPERPVLLVNPRIPAFDSSKCTTGWNGVDGGPLGDWREGRNDLESGNRRWFRKLAWVFDWPRGSMAPPSCECPAPAPTCFAFFKQQSPRAMGRSEAGPSEWWRLATSCARKLRI